MTIGLEGASTTVGVLAVARVDTGLIYYVGLAVVVAIVIGTLAAFFRIWMEIHEDEEPDTPEELLESFQEAHAAGEIDERELARVREVLSVGGAVEAGAFPERRPARSSMEGEDGKGGGDGSDSARARETEPRST